MRQLRHDLATAKSQLENVRTSSAQYENLADQNTADLAELERQSADLLAQLADLESASSAATGGTDGIKRSVEFFNETYRAYEQEDRQLQGQLQQLYR